MGFSLAIFSRLLLSWCEGKGKQKFTECLIGSRMLAGLSPRCSCPGPVTVVGSTSNQADLNMAGMYLVRDWEVRKN